MFRTRNLQFIGKEKKIFSNAANLDEDQQNILRNHSERNLVRSQQSCISKLGKCKSGAVKGTIQLLFIKGLFDVFENKVQIFESYLTFSDDYLLVGILRNRNINIRWCVLLIGRRLFNKTNRVEYIEERPVQRYC